MLVLRSGRRRDRLRGGRRSRLFRHVAFGEQLLNAAYRVAVLVEKLVDAPGQSDVGRPIIAPIAGALQRTQLGEAGLPVAQYMLRDPEVGGELSDRPEGLVALSARARHRRRQPPRAIRSRMI